jgi:hypothetical protein
VIGNFKRLRSHHGLSHDHAEVAPATINHVGAPTDRSVILAQRDSVSVACQTSQRKKE